MIHKQMFETLTNLEAVDESLLGLASSTVPDELQIDVGHHNIELGGSMSHTL